MQLILDCTMWILKSVSAFAHGIGVVSTLTLIGILTTRRNKDPKGRLLPYMSLSAKRAPWYPFSGVFFTLISFSSYLLVNTPISEQTFLVKATDIFASWLISPLVPGVYDYRRKPTTVNALKPQGSKCYHLIVPRVKIQIKVFVNSYILNEFYVVTYLGYHFEHIYRITPGT